MGKNNIGKTSLLEAIQLYAQKGDFSLIIKMLEVREEGVIYGDVLEALKYLFYGRKAISTDTNPIIIGPIGSTEKMLQLSISWDITEFKDGKIQTRPLQSEESYSNAILSPRFNQHIDNHTLSFPFEALLSSIMLKPSLNSINNYYVTSDGLDRGYLAELWDKVALREAEDDVLYALRIVALGIERLYFRGDARDGKNRVPVVRVADSEEPLPLRSLGDGIQRILGFALALVNAKDGLLLIDEVENGIHYSALLEVWQLIFRIAHRLNIQVFTTTHSRDCLEAFQQAALEDQHEEALLVRLNENEEGIDVTLIDEGIMGAAVRTHTEIR